MDKNENIIAEEKGGSLTELEEHRLAASKALEIVQIKRLTSLIESIPDFARDRDETTWNALYNASGKAILQENDIRTMQEQALKLYFSDASVRGLIETFVNFIVGKDANVIPIDEDEKVIKYWDRFQEVNKWDMRSKEFVRRTIRDGEVFLRFFAPEEDPPEGWDSDEEYIPIPKVRFVSPLEIKDTKGHTPYGITTDPDDIENILVYHRTYTRNSEEVNEEIPAEEIIHTKYLVDSDIKRGVSILVGLAPYFVKYKTWLDDRIMLNKIRTMFNLIMKVTGDPAALKAKFEDTTVREDLERKKMPARGSVLVGTKGIEYEFANLNIRAQDTKDDGRAIELMIAKGTGFVEYIVRGDASNANYSSSMVSESPMVKMLEAQQDFFEKPYKDVFRKVVKVGKDVGYIPGATKQRITVINPETGKADIKVEELPTSTKCNVNFTQLIHREPKKQAEAYQIHSERKWASDQTISKKLGYDPETERELITQEEARMSEDERNRRDRNPEDNIPNPEDNNGEDEN